MTDFMTLKKTELVKRLHRAYDHINEVYTQRNKLVALCAMLAQGSGLYAGLGKDEEAEPGWQHVIYIELPAGQVSFHVPDEELPFFRYVGTFELPWDGHTTEEKFNRILNPGFLWLRDEGATEAIEAVEA